MTANVIADDLFRMTLGVKVCGIDEVAAELNEAIDDSLRLLNAGPPAEVLAKGHCAEAEWTYTQAGTAEGNVVIEGHGILRVGIWYNYILVPIDDSLLLN